MSFTLIRPAAGLALLAALVAGCGNAVAAQHHTAPKPAVSAHLHSGPTPTVVTTPPVPSATTPPAPSANPIPQGNGGDQDADNNGGPSDGDGNISPAGRPSDGRGHGPALGTEPAARPGDREESVTRLAARRGTWALAALAAAAAIAITAAASVLPGRSTGQAFHLMAPAAAPAGWQHVTLPNGTAVLSYPPSLRRIAGDNDAVSAARLGPDGRLQLYLNATPGQGTERPAHWAAFRLSRLRSDDAVSAREDAVAVGVKFRGGTGSCVIDDYVTRIGGHHYQEIACLVQGRTSASVIVAASPASMWVQARPLLLQAVAAYLVR